MVNAFICRCPLGFAQQNMKMQGGGDQMTHQTRGGGRLRRPPPCGDSLCGPLVVCSALATSCFFDIWPRLVFLALAPYCFFGTWPHLFFWHLAPYYFIGKLPPLLLLSATLFSFPVQCNYWVHWNKKNIIYKMYVVLIYFLFCSLGSGGLLLSFYIKYVCFM